MHSFHHSRGRILFEVFCALAISASCAGAWLQTGASAFLPAAFVAALYGLWHMTDMRARTPAVAFDMGHAPLAPADQADLLEYLETVEPAATAGEGPEVWEAAPQAEPAIADPVEVTVTEAVKPAKPRTKRSRKAVEKVASPAVEPPVHEEFDHPPIAPLFEPEPFVRQARPIFGRKAG